MSGVPPISSNERLWTFLRWMSFRSQRHKLLYVATPKAACTTLTWWFAELEGHADAVRAFHESGETAPELMVHDAFHRVAPEVTGLLPQDLAPVLESDEYFRFAVVRNPYRRIFSAWQSKLLLREPLQSGPYVDCEFFNRPIRGEADLALAFEGFLEHVAAHEAPAFRDYHWTPQANLLRPDLVSYSQIARLEDPGDLVASLAHRLRSSPLLDTTASCLLRPRRSRRTNSASPSRLSCWCAAATGALRRFERRFTPGSTTWAVVWTKVPH